MARSFTERKIATENLISIDSIRKQLKDRPLDIRTDANTVSGTSNSIQSAEKFFKVGFVDIDEALMYYFREVLKPKVTENNEEHDVPVMYGNPERWNTMQKYGYYRDKKSKLILPLIMYRKSNVSRWDNLYWPRLDDLYIMGKRNWSKKKMYSDFEIKAKEQNKDIQTDNYTLTSIPNYLIVSYEVVIWSSYIEQINGLMEKIIFSEGTYWGDPDKYKFRCEVDGFDEAVDMTDDTQRFVRATFNVSCYGYILPEDFKEKNTSRVSFAPKKIVFKENTNL